MRAILSFSDIGRSPAGNVIFQKKVVPRIQTTSPKLRELLITGLEDVVVETENGL
jgi:hypothetical protein